MSKLDRFLKAQEKQYEIALNEIKSGKKQTDWMLYIFPQIKGLGFTDMSKNYAIENIDEAIEYLNNDILRTRLMEICQALLDLGKVDINQVMGFPDDLKLKSCMTLFKEAEAKSLDDEKCDNIFQKVLDQFYDGEDDPKTLVVLQRQEFEKEFGIEPKEEGKEEIKMNEKMFENNINNLIDEQKKKIKTDNIDTNVSVQEKNTSEENEITINKMMSPETPGNDEITNEEEKLKQKKDFRITSLILDEENNEQRNVNTHSNDLKDLKDLKDEENESKCCQCIII